MPLTIPDLDDRRFKELVTTLRDHIPSFTRQWTDYNTSDPGITLLELWCWLAEMIIYRINQVPQKTFNNFFKLILDLPEPVKTTVMLFIYPQIIPLTIPPGIRFATESYSPLPTELDKITENGQLIFETYEPTPIPVIPFGSPPDFSPPEIASPPDFIPITMRVRSKVVVKNELLGTSSGQPDQIFYLQKGPVLLDDNNLGSDYNPNPKISVDGESWEYIPASDFIDIEKTGPESQYFMIEQRTGGVRFGNGVRGKIPPLDAEIKAEEYHIILGKEVRIGRDMLKKRLDDIPGLHPFDILDNIKNEPSEGGFYIYPDAEKGSTGLRSYKEKFRAVTVKDFEELASTQFNLAQESLIVKETSDNRVARAIAVTGKKLDGTPPFQDLPATISVIILPRPQGPEEVKLTPSSELKKRVLRFLDSRRLITTRVHVVGPDYAPVSLEIEVSREPRTSAQKVESEIDNKIRQFFHPLKGGDKGNGWAIGRDVYISEIFQLIESVEGVNHVNKIVMNGTPSLDKITIADNQLPLIENITLNL